jgi:adenylyltransferase/sulfurtransferase
MSVTVSIPTPLRGFTGGRDAIAVSGATVGEVLDALLAVHGGLKRHLVQEDGRLRSFVNLYLNDTDIRQLASTATRVSEGDVLTIVPSIAGGSPATEAALPKLSHAEVLRYSRHLLLPEVGVEGQRKLKAARVLAIGAGGLGSPLSLYLAAAGVGTIGIVDFDLVDLTNLQRQIVHATERVGQDKTSSAARGLATLNPGVRITTINQKLEGATLDEQVRLADAVVDATDNFASRFAINESCMRVGKPLISGAVVRFEGQVAVFPPGGPCYRCLYAEGGGPDEACATLGVLAPVAGIIGSIEAVETIKVLLGIGQTLVGRLLLFDALAMEWREMKLHKDPACPVCGNP